MERKTKYSGFGRTHITTCKLLTGEIVEYDLCDSEEENEGFELIGRGIIWKVDGVIQGYNIKRESDLKYFFKRK